MTAPHDPHDPLDRAIRAALGDVVAEAPRRGDVPERGDDSEVTAGVRRRVLVGAATALTAAAGIVAIVAVSTRTMITTDVARSSLAVTTTQAPPTTGAAPSTTSTSTPATTTTVASTPGPLQRVEFRRGTNNTSVDAELVPGTTDRYLLEAGSDQRMVVNVDSDVADISFSIVAPDGTALAADEVVAAVELPADGDYVVEVTTSGEAGPYTIDFLIN
jgi:hypothetical protein